MLRFFKGAYHLLITVISLVWFRFPARKLTVIGVTGTDGKTTTASLIYKILIKSGIKTSMITSVHAVIAGNTYDTGFHVTTPNSFYIQKYLREAVDHGDSHMVLEVTSHALSQFRVWGIPFRVGVLTNITHEHLDWHGTYQRYLNTKFKLLKSSKTAILNRDEAMVYNIALSKLKGHKMVTYGIHRKAEVSPSTIHIRTQLPGVYNLYNCLAASACAKTLNISKSVIEKAVAEFEGVTGRMEVIQDKPYQVIVDFAHTPNALEQVLKTVRAKTKRNIIHVFGSAGERDRTKRPLMGRASDKFSDTIILTEEDYRTEDLNNIMNQIESGILKKEKVTRINDRDDAIRQAIKIAKSGDTVIITGKGHEKSLCRGKVEYPWSDQEAVRETLGLH